MFENDKIIFNIIDKIKLKKGKKNFSHNLRLIYKELIIKKIIDRNEMIYLDAWIDDCKYLLSKE